MRAFALVVLLVATVAACCHSSPADAPDQPLPAVQGTYLGIGSYNTQTTNVELSLTNASIVTSLQGRIRLLGTTDTLTDVRLAATGDTVSFRYFVNSAIHRAWALVGRSSVELHHTEPAGIPPFRLNRLVDRFNLTGLWSGWMTSQYFQDSRTATMRMDQQGQLFYGEVRVTLLEPTLTEIGAGVSNGSGFNLSGTMRVGGGQEPASFLGSYLTSDTIRGSWQAGSNGTFDRGLFEFVRLFN